MRRLLLPLAALALAVAAEAADDVVLLLNGDRVSGRVVGRITRRVRLQTPYGVLVIPADKVERIRKADGSEEVLSARPSPPPAPAPPPPPPVVLEIVLSGATFWQAWDPRSAPQDPSLRLEVRLDERAVAAFTDANLDPEDLPGAVVNSFVFAPGRLFVAAGEGATAAPPVLTAGEIRLPITLPPSLAGRRRLALAYQVNDAGSAAPSWRDVVLATGEVDLDPAAPARVRVRQDRGTMEYAKRRMRNVESFRAVVGDEPGAPPAP